MQTFEFIVFLLVAIFISAILDEATPRIAMPLVQIALGIVIFFVQPNMAHVQLDPELFLVLFIAPLLFDETRNVDKLALWKNKLSILSLAIGLVVVCVLACGFALHAIEPSIPLAAAFALGAALAPTDAVAVAALGKNVELSSRQKALLSGEALINDASGVVSFQFALAAAVTGAFSATQAITTFCLDFFGGIGIGILLGLLLRSLRGFLRLHGLESTTVHVVLEVLAPFLFYMVAEAVGLSGILAVVAAGLAMSLGPVKAGASAAKLNIVSNTVWEVLVFVINGAVFVMLGMQLPTGIMPSWFDSSLQTPELIGLVLLLTVVIVAVRFAWMLALEALAKPENHLDNPSTASIVIPETTVAAAMPAVDPFEDPVKRKQILEEMHEREVSEQRRAQERLEAMHARRDLKDMVRSALVTTFAGPKGAITLSIIFTIPTTVESGAAFPERNMIIFLAAGTILCTLLLANFLVPLLAPKQPDPEEGTRNREAELRILRSVITELHDGSTPENAKATALVMRRYRERIRRLRASDVSREQLQELRREVIAAQQQVVHDAIVSNAVPREAGQDFANRLKTIDKLTKYHVTSSKAAPRPWKHTFATASPLFVQKAASFLHVDAREVKDKASMRTLLLMTERGAVRHLEERAESPDPEVANAAALLLMEHRATLQSYEMRFAIKETGQLFQADSAPLIDIDNLMQAERNAENAYVQEIAAEGYRIELEKIQEFLEAGRISRSAAQDMRENVYLLQMDLSDAL